MAAAHFVPSSERARSLLRKSKRMVSDPTAAQVAQPLAAPHAVPSPQPIVRRRSERPTTPAVQRYIFQTKMMVGAAHDVYEREAERVAAQVTGEPVSAPASKSGSHVQRQEEVDAGVGPQGGVVGPKVDAALRQARGRGQTLDPATRVDMQRGFGMDFGKVRVHSDHRSDTLNRALNAKAFTSGSDIFFRRNAYTPGRKEGKRLLAHELTHVVQQGAAERQPRSETASSHADQGSALSVQRKTSTGIQRFTWADLWKRNGEAGWNSHTKGAKAAMLLPGFGAGFMGGGAAMKTGEYAQQKGWGKARTGAAKFGAGLGGGLLGLAGVPLWAMGNMLYGGSKPSDTASDRRGVAGDVTDVLGTIPGITGLVGTGGTGNTGKFEGSVAEDWFGSRDTSTQQNMNISGASDIVGGGLGMAGNMAGLLEDIATLRSGDAGKLDKTEASLSMLSNTAGLVSNAGALAGGAAYLHEAQGNATQSNLFSSGTPLSADPKAVGDWAGVASSGLGLLASGVGGAKQFKGWIKSLKKDGKLRERGGWSIARSVGRGGRTLADMGAKSASLAKGIALLTGQIQGGGATHVGGNVVTAAKGAVDTAAQASMASGILSAVVGGAQMGAGGYKIFKAGRRRSKLTGRMGEAEAGQSRNLSMAANMDRMADARTSAGRDASSLEAYADNLRRGAGTHTTNLKAFEHLKEIQKKKQVRGGIDAALGAAGVLSGVLTATGFGAIPGAVIGGTTGAFMLGQLGFRHFKQAMRDKAAKRQHQGRGNKWWNMFDTTKTTALKDERNQETMQAILAMQGEDRDVSLDALGLSEKQLNKGMADEDLDKERAARLKKERKKAAKAWKKDKTNRGAFDATAWEAQFLQNNAHMDDYEEFKKLLREERILKALKKR